MNGPLIPCIIENLRTRKDNSIALTLGTQELSQGTAAELFGLRNQLVAVYFSPKETISQQEMNQVDELDPEIPGKTPSQRLRGVLFILFSQDAEGHKDFKSYYSAKMEKVIEHMKTKIKDE